MCGIGVWGGVLCGSRVARRACAGMWGGCAVVVGLV